MNTLARLEMIRRTRATVLFCTPSYALRLAETAAEQPDRRGRPRRAANHRRRRARGQRARPPQTNRNAWNARVIDHAGASEIGPWGYGDRRAGASTSSRPNSSPSISRSNRAGRQPRPASPNCVLDVARPVWQPGHPLPHGRRRPPAICGQRIQPLRPARRGRVRPHRRHADRPRRQRLSQLGRANPADLSRNRRVSRHGPPAEFDGPAWLSRSKTAWSSPTASPASCNVRLGLKVDRPLRAARFAARASKGKANGSLTSAKPRITYDRSLSLSRREGTVAKRWSAA